MEALPTENVLTGCEVDQLWRSLCVHERGEGMEGEEGRKGEKEERGEGVEREEGRKGGRSGERRGEKGRGGRKEGKADKITVVLQVATVGFRQTHLPRVCFCCRQAEVWSESAGP